VIHKFNNAIREKRHFSFCVVRAFALASKHCQLTRPLARKGYHSGNYKVARPGFLGASFMRDMVGGVTIRWKGRGHVNLSKALTKTLEFYETEFPEIV
jgi:hypothetical protein